MQCLTLLVLYPEYTTTKDVEQRGGAPLCRSVTSDVSALSGFGANGHQTISTFPPPSLKFRTVGFPQYGF
ncbi:MAG: hypothetical protein ACE5HC_09795, partial [Candidatus Binatia bacterium]